MHSCPVCSSSDVEIFFEMNDIPVHCNVLLATREEAVNAPRGDMKLGFCRSCGHIYNAAFKPALMVYTQAYENSLHFSPRFQQFAEELARGLISRYDLHGKDIIELGCGKGDFLKLMCDLGENRGYGFDASYEPELMNENATQERFTVIQDFYSPKYSAYNADFVCCRHVLEHIEFPNEFVDNVRLAIGSRMNAVIYFEVPNALWTLQDLGIWDLIYEHCSYFTANSLSRLFSLHGFEVKRLDEHFHQQFLGIELVPKNSDPSNWKSGLTINDVAKYVAEFAENYRTKVEAWKKQFERLKSEGKRSIVWGGGSKGITFLNVMKQHADIDYMVDLNPRKQGMYVSGSGQKIISPEFLKDYQPDAVIIMNPIYTDEIRRMLSDLGIQPELIPA